MLDKLNYEKFLFTFMFKIIKKVETYFVTLDTPCHHKTWNKVVISKKLL